MLWRITKWWFFQGRSGFVQLGKWKQTLVWKWKIETDWYNWPVTEKLYHFKGYNLCKWLTIDEAIVRDVTSLVQNVMQRDFVM